MKVYRGYSDQGNASGPVSLVVYEEGQKPYKLRHMIMHSPSGMSWGYQGSGAADLALSVLADWLGEVAAVPAHERYDHAIAGQIQETGAWLLHQEFKRDFVATLPQDRNVTINGVDIETWLEPRRAALDEWRIPSLIGKRVMLTSGAVVDVLDSAEGETQPSLVVYVIGDTADHRIVPLADVIRALGPIPDDDGEAVRP